MKARAAYYDSGCNEVPWSDTGARWPDRQYYYYINQSFPGGLISPVQAGLAQWGWHNPGECYDGLSYRYAQQVFRFSYLGRTGSYYLQRDSRNVIDLGHISDCGVSDPLACNITWLDYSPEPNRILESDTRFSYNWYARGRFSTTTSAPGYQWNTGAVSAHEAGHSLGLGHVTGSRQTMNATINIGDNEAYTLGRGDLCGFFVKYYEIRCTGTG